MDEVRYSIKDLEHFTKIKAHTIRIWEQRYKLLKPKRTDTNIRYYSEADLKKILNINLLYNAGYKISKIASLTESEIIDLSKDIIINKEGENDSDLNSIIVNLLSFKGEEINEMLVASLKTKDIDELYVSLVKPLLVKLGELWQVNSIDVTHEHYFSNIYRQFLISQIEGIHTKPNANKKALLFLHDDEEHEFSLLLSYYLLKKAGYKCYYFGQKVPIKELSSAVKTIEPNFILTHFTSKIGGKNYKWIESQLVEYTSKSKVLIGGAQLDRLDFPISNKLTHIKSSSELKSIIN